MTFKSFKNISFQKKVFIIGLLCSLFPTITLGFSCYYREKTLLISREENALTDSLTQEANLLDSQFDTYQNIMNYISWNQNLNLAMRHNYEKVSDMFITYRDTIDPLFNTLKTLSGTIKNITLYTNAPIFPHGNILRPLSDIENTGWYSDVYDNYRIYWMYSMEEPSLSLACRMYKSQGSRNSIVKIDLDYSLVFQTLESIYDSSYGVLMTDETGEPLYHFHTPDMQDTALTAAQLLEEASYHKLQKDYVIQTADVYNRWKLFLYRPIHTVHTPVLGLRFLILGIVLVSLTGVFGISLLLSRYISRPLNSLMENMRQVEEGSFVLTVTWDSADEVGCLVASFHNMVQKLHHLVDEVLKGELLQRKYEMAALQAQINPHFLYNSLSLINSRAILSDQEEIQQMVQYLTTFYRTSLNKGKNILSVREELENVRSYINIQLLMHSDSFDVAYHIEDEILSLSMINFCLQPLVENAILHGIDHREDTGERGKLCLFGFRSEEMLIFEITDNGPGIPSSVLEHILTLDRGGYGIQNVHRRIQLTYGNQYGLFYNSGPNTGTKVTLTLPVTPSPPPSPYRSEGISEERDRSTAEE